MTQDTTTVEKKEEVVGKLVWGKEGVQHPTPFCATVVFRAEFLATKAVLVFLAGTTLVGPVAIKETILILSCLDVFVWGMARQLGIKKPEE